jgi:hypothetical protein
MGGVCATCGGADFWTGFCGTFGAGSVCATAASGHKAKTATARARENRMTRISSKTFSVECYRAIPEFGNDAGAAKREAQADT